MTVFLLTQLFIARGFRSIELEAFVQDLSVCIMLLVDILRVLECSSLNLLAYGTQHVDMYFT